MIGQSCAIAGLLCLVSSCYAQTTQVPDPAEKPVVAAPADPVPRLKFSGLVDGYYSMNFNHPESRNNAFRNFDIRTNRLRLNLAKFTLERDAAPIGFKLELAGGDAADIIHLFEPAGPNTVKTFLQAYVSFKPAKWKGLQVDFGKFNTSAGAEVTETNLNWNYSRSYLYANGPYYHVGARASVPLGKYWSAGAQLVNGWNNLEDNNKAKTVGLTSTFTTAKFLWANNYYVGNEKTDKINGVKIDAKGVRHFYDTVVSLNRDGRVSGLFNFDFGEEANPGTTGSRFYGLSVATRVIGNKILSFSPRYDWYKDRDGLITGSPNTLQEFTMTADIKMRSNFLTRFEYRRDWSENPVFDRGYQTRNADRQNTVVVGLVFWFSMDQ